ncbi:hypothetical protein [Ileibacterium valens]|uniref:hypothetical protein n=1 Tax=Ileibacterium valens TaxID=1862668 RepID=UPI00259B5CF6|nr:hypothetical protein [Ileibacterium valens]
MLAKVFTSVFVQIFKKIWMVALIFSIFGLLSFGLGFLDGTLSILVPVLQITALVLGVVMIFYSFLVCWQFFRNSFYQDQAFLYQTLPVKRSILFYGELSAFICWQIIIFALLLCGLWIGMIDQSTRDSLITIVHDGLPLVMGSTQNVWLLIFLFGCACFEQMICEMIAGIFGICAGYSTLKDKLGKSVIIGVCSYYGLAAVMLGILFGIAKSNPKLWLLLESNGLGEEIIPLLAWLALLYLIVIGLLIGASYFIIRKGINID